MNGFKSIFGGVLWSIISNVIGAGYGFLSVPILLNYFGKEQYGLIGIALSVNVYLRILDMGFSSGNVKFFSTYLVKEDFDGLNKLFQSSLFFYITIALINASILFGLTFYCKEVFHLTTYEAEVFKNLLYILILTSIPVWASNVMEQLLRSKELVAWQQRVFLLTKIGQIVSLILTIYFKLSIVVFFAINITSSLIVIPFYVVRIKKMSLGLSFIPMYYKKTMEEVLPYCLSVFSFGLFQFSANYLRPVLLGMKLGLSSVTDFRLIEGIANLILILGSSFLGVILPYATKARATGDKEAEIQIASSGTRYISIFLAFTIFGFVLSSKELISMYVGEQNAYLSLWFNVWAISLFGLHSSALSSLVLSGNTLKPIVYMSAFSTIFSLTAAWFLMDYFGIGGVIISYSLYVLSQMGYYYIYYYPNKLGYSSGDIFIHSFFIPVAVIGAICLVVYYIMGQIIFSKPYYSIIVKEVIFVGISILITYNFFLKKNERVYLKDILSNIVRSKKKTTEAS